VDNKNKKLLNGLKKTTLKISQLLHSLQVLQHLQEEEWVMQELLYLEGKEEQNKK